jgi:hypothetical protein
MRPVPELADGAVVPNELASILVADLVGATIEEILLGLVVLGFQVLAL